MEFFNIEKILRILRILKILISGMQLVTRNNSGATSFYD